MQTKNKHTTRRKGKEPSPTTHVIVDNKDVVKDGATFTLESPFPMTQIRLPKDNRFSVTQMFQVNANWFQTSTTVPTFTYVNFNLGQVHQSANFASMFDRYRILEAEVWIIPQTSADISLRQGEFYSVLDYDDSTLLTNVGSALDYPTCVGTPQSYGHYRKLRPRAAYALQTSATSNYNGNIVSPWCDTVDPLVNHFGIKIAATVSQTAVQTFDLQIRLRLEFKNVR